MKDLKFVIKEHRENWYKIFKLSWYDFIVPLRDTVLGPLWIVLSPMLQIGVYWFVFGLGIRGGKPVDGHPYLLWMLSGLIPWFYISACIGGGGTCIYGKASILTKMKFPTSIIPTYSTFTRLFNNIPVLLIMIIVYAFHGYRATPYYFQLIYYVFAATFICIAFTFLNSALVMAIRDVNKVIGTVLRFTFYMTPILWSPERMSPMFQSILKLNPLIYIVEGFRNSLLYNKPFYEDIAGGIYFWSLAIIVFIVGVKVHMKLRNRFSDLM